MSFTDKLKSRLAEMQQAAENLVASSELSQSRFDICQACPHFIKLTAQCKKCGCFMHAKTKIAGAQCPVGKW